MKTITPICHEFPIEVSFYALIVTSSKKIILILGCLTVANST